MALLVLCFILWPIVVGRARRQSDAASASNKAALFLLQSVAMVQELSRFVCWNCVIGLVDSVDDRFFLIDTQRAAMVENPR